MNNKHIFWIAIIAALVVFWTGILVGLYFENSRVNWLKEQYFNSETDVFDFRLASDMVFTSDISCEELNVKTAYFADQIYNEASKLEKIDNSNRLTDQLIPVHKRYDLLRVMLWNEILKNKKECYGKINTVVYLYNYTNNTFDNKATQGAMGNYLTDIKMEYNNSIILIPIAADTGVQSLNIIRERYDIQNIPVIIINEEYKFENLDSLKEIRYILNKTIEAEKYNATYANKNMSIRNILKS